MKLCIRGIISFVALLTVNNILFGFTPLVPSITYPEGGYRPDGIHSTVCDQSPRNHF